MFESLPFKNNERVSACEATHCLIGPTQKQKKMLSQPIQNRKTQFERKPEQQTYKSANALQHRLEAAGVRAAGF
jgi:hypothetical protein